MQISLERFFDLISDRFGKRISTALLALIAVAIAIFACNIIITQGISPLMRATSSLLAGNPIEIRPRDVIPFVISSIVPVASVLLAYQLLLRRHITPAIRDVNQAILTQSQHAYKLNAVQHKLEEIIAAEQLLSDDSTTRAEQLENINRKLAELIPVMGDLIRLVGQDSNFLRQFALAHLKFHNELHNLDIGSDEWRLWAQHASNHLDPSVLPPMTSHSTPPTQHQHQ